MNGLFSLGRSGPNLPLRAIRGRDRRGTADAATVAWAVTHRNPIVRRFCDSSPLRRWYLEDKLARLQSVVDGLKRKRAKRRRAGPVLPIIPGGAASDEGDDGPPDKPPLNERTGCRRSACLVR